MCYIHTIIRSNRIDYDGFGQHLWYCHYYSNKIKMLVRPLGYISSDKLQIDKLALKNLAKNYSFRSCLSIRPDFTTNASPTYLLNHWPDHLCWNTLSYSGLPTFLHCRHSRLPGESHMSEHHLFSPVVPKCLCNQMQSAWEVAAVTLLIF